MLESIPIPIPGLFTKKNEPKIGSQMGHIKKIFKKINSLQVVKSSLNSSLVFFPPKRLSQPRSQLIRLLSREALSAELASSLGKATNPNRIA